jgi:soluble lytic murein transglycosylase-like protein
MSRDRFHAIRCIIYLVFAFGVALLALLLPAQAQAQVPPAAARYRGELVRQSRLVFGLEAPVAALAAQVHQESGWRPDAHSVYAHGLTQFTPDTAEWIGTIDAELADADTGNPAWALRALAVYDRWLLDRVKGATACDRWWAVERCYNGGLGHWLKEARLAAPATDRGAIDARCGQASRSPKHCAENLGYPQRILLKWQPLYMGWGPGVKCT